MKKLPVQFHNDRGDLLCGDLYRPSRSPHAYVLLAHCFTCAANFKAPVKIARALSRRGFGVLAFDFTGLGRSGGEFADTNLTTNVGDLVAAAAYLESEHGVGPAVLVGHSLGGTAALAAAPAIEACKAVVTIAAPSSARRIVRLLEAARPELDAAGEAVVNIGGRPFRIKRQLLEDLERHDVPRSLAALRRALLIMHSPADAVVPLADAEELFAQATHPKSFVDLDGADHLLGDEAAAEYAAHVLAAWSSRYVDAAPVPEDAGDEHAVVARTPSGGFVTEIHAGRHELVADEPVRLGGSDAGPTPYQLISAALASCTGMTLQLYARRKGLALDAVTVSVRHGRIHAEDCADCEAGAPKIDRFEREVVLEGELDDAARQRLLEIAARCPVHRTLSEQARIETTLAEGAAPIA